MVNDTERTDMDDVLVDFISVAERMGIMLRESN